MPTLSVYFPEAQNSERQILLASKMSCSFLLLTLKNLVIAMVELFAAMSNFSTQMADFEFVFKTVYSNPLNMAPTTLCLLGGIWNLDKTDYYRRKLRQCYGVFLFGFFLRKREEIKKIGRGRLQMPDSTSDLLQSIMTAFLVVTTHTIQRQAHVLHGILMGLQIAMKRGGRTLGSTSECRRGKKILTAFFYFFF